MKNNKHIGYDETKKMLNTLRKLSENLKSTHTIREQQEINPDATQNMKNDLIVINDVDVKMISSDNMDMKLSDEQKTSISNIIDAFRQQVSQLVEFDPGMSITTDQVRLDGKITDLDFRFTLVAGKEAGLYIVSDMTEVTSELIDILSKFNKFYQSYIEPMNKLITDRKNN